MKKITLKNGLRVILVPQKDSLSTTVLVLVEAGSKYETREINGLSHFLEHMCFKGTKRRPTAMAIASELEGIGASYNAFTGHEYTGYYAKARNAHAKNILDIVSDIYLNLKFDKNEIEKERGVIIEEINRYEDLPERKIWHLFFGLLYGDQPAGWKISGTKEVIKKLNRDDFIKYHNEHYVANSTIVIVAGKFSEKEVVKEIKKRFSKISKNKKSGKLAVVESQKVPKVVINEKKTDQAYIALGVRAFDAFDERKYALQVMEDILGGSMSSRLFQKIREEMGAAYVIHAGSDLLTDHGLFSVYVGANNEKAEEVIKAILKELKKMADKKVSVKELKRSKEHLIGGLAIGLETSNSLASYYGEQEVMTREMETPEQLIKKIESVTAAEIQKIAKDIFKNEKLNLAIIGPFKDKVRFEKILKF